MKIVALRRVILPMAVLAAPNMLLAQTTTPEMPGTPPEIPGAPAPGEAEPPTQPQPGIPAPPNDPTRPSPIPESPATPTPSETPMPPATPTPPMSPANPTMEGATGQQAPAGASVGTQGDWSAGNASSTPGRASGGIRWAPRAAIPAPAPSGDYPPCTATRQDQCTQMSDRKPRRGKARHRSH